METDKIIEELLNILVINNITNKNILLDVLTGFLYSVGAQLEQEEYSSGEEVLKAYGQKPSMGNALMAQSLWMRDNWRKE